MGVKLKFLVICIATAVAVCAPLSAEPRSDAPQRFSIAVSGGASRGAYEAGLNWAILQAGQLVSGKDHILGGTYRDIDVASVAGASAGGINSLLTGLSWCLRPESKGGIPNRIDNNIFRDIWFAPDINNLLPRTADSEIYLPDDGVLSRADLVAASATLREKWTKPIFRPNCHASMGVTVTRVSPQILQMGDVRVPNQRFAVPFEFRTRSDGSGNFFFDPNDYRGHRDQSMILLPYLDKAENHQIDDTAVENVILASSAFPIAFGRRRLEYCRLPSREGSSAAADNQQQNKSPRETSARCPPGYELDEADFADGGLFDNLPIGLARTLAELNVRAKSNPWPVTYIYLDPERERDERTADLRLDSCQGDNPPAACRQMEFGLRSQSSLLLDAFGTARKFELYRELTSESWSLNLSELGYTIADEMERNGVKINCDKELPWFEKSLQCPNALRRGGLLLEIAYDRTRTPITSPYSVDKLRDRNIARRCSKPSIKTDVPVQAECEIAVHKYRYDYAQSLLKVLKRSRLQRPDIEQRIRKSVLSLHHDRSIRVTSRGAQITGSLLGGFGAFLELKFREYDYYTGVYDATVLISDSFCRSYFSPRWQPEEYHVCGEKMLRQASIKFGIDSNARARYVFALLAREEFGEKGRFRFAYEPMPAEDTDMRIIHDGLARAHAEYDPRVVHAQGQFAIERAFFDELRAREFNPTPTDDGSESLLARFMRDPEQWSYEFVRRFTNRLVHLEQQSEKVLELREPDPEKRPDSMTGLVAGGSYALQTMTYDYPPFAFAPSVASKEWVWRNVIPYEFAFDLVDQDLQLTWQPTWNVSKRNNLSIRGTIGFADGLIRSASEKSRQSDPRENYVALGFGYTRLTGSNLFSGWGVTPTYFHQWNEPSIGKQDTAGFDVHAGLFNNRLRLAVGSRDVNELSDNWFFMVGFADLPGLIYWLTR